MTIGFLFCVINYQSPNKKYRQIMQNLSAIMCVWIIVTFFIYYNFEPFKHSFNPLLGWFFVFGAILVGQIIYIFI